MGGFASGAEPSVAVAPRAVAMVAVVFLAITAAITATLPLGWGQACAVAGTLFFWLNHNDMKSALATAIAAALVQGGNSVSTSCFRKGLLAGCRVFNSLGCELSTLLLFARAGCLATALAPDFASPAALAAGSVTLALRGVFTPDGRARGVWTTMSRETRAGAAQSLPFWAFFGFYWKTHLVVVLDTMVVPGARLVFSPRIDPRHCFFLRNEHYNNNNNQGVNTST